MTTAKDFAKHARGVKFKQPRRVSMTKIVIELTAEEARTVSRGLFRAYDTIVGPFTHAREYAIKSAARIGAHPDTELENLENIAARVDAALKQAGERGASELLPEYQTAEGLTGSAH